MADQDPDAAFSIARALRKRNNPLEGILVLINGGQLGQLELRDELYDDFCLTPFQPRELEARLAHLLLAARPRVAARAHRVRRARAERRDLSGVDLGRPLDLTYMEYELLKFLASHPGKVFTRETLLSRVWGYDYFGGARTVDVHVRRLRAKLGEGHAGLIQTVRSVGYRFGQSRWE